MNTICAVTLANDLASWSAASADDKEAFARSSCSALGLEFCWLVHCEQGGQRHLIAVARSEGYIWTLIPGGRARLGYQPASFTPTTEQLDSYLESQEEYELPPLEEYLRTTLSIERERLIAPFWMEAASTPLWREEISARGRWDGRLPQPEDGPLPRPLLPKPYRELSIAPADWAVAARKPWRLPTPDEWEWACRGGTSTLFRWGDHCPGNVYPDDNVAFAELGPPNAFGLSIAMDPYLHELTSDPTVSVGGDAAMVCGGAGFFVAWLTLASAWQTSIEDPNQPASGLHLRRCIPLAQ